MGEYKGPDNVYWLFSSAAQSIAALIGFLAAGFTFAHERLDRQVEKDETLEEINERIKFEYYKRLSSLLKTTGFSIGCSLLAVFLNGYDLGALGLLIKWFVAILNLFTLLLGIRFVVYIIDPKKVKKVAEELIKEDRSIAPSQEPTTVTGGQFITRFIELERLIRNFVHQNITNINDYGPVRGHEPLGRLITYLLRAEIINKEHAEILREISKVRNLAVHGEVPEVSAELLAKVNQLIQVFKEKSEA